jgi:hypothetical protein
VQIGAFVSFLKLDGCEILLFKVFLRILKFEHFKLHKINDLLVYWVKR